MRYRVTIDASTGAFTAEFEDLGGISNMVDMVRSGAQLNQAASFSITDTQTNDMLSVHGGRLSVLNAVEGMLQTLGALPPKTRQPPKTGQNYDVVVSVHLAASSGATLVDVEDFVRRAVDAALEAEQERAEKAERPYAPRFMYNSETVTPGSAEEDK